jgi:hypothetical protein
MSGFDPQDQMPLLVNIEDRLQFILDNVALQPSREVLDDQGPSEPQRECEHAALV